MVIKGRTHLHNPAVKRCSFFKFVGRFDMTCHQGVNKIKACKGGNPEDSGGNKSERIVKIQFFLRVMTTSINKNVHNNIIS